MSYVEQYLFISVYNIHHCSHASGKNVDCCKWLVIRPFCERPSKDKCYYILMYFLCFKV